MVYNYLTVVRWSSGILIPWGRRVRLIGPSVAQAWRGREVGRRRKVAGADGPLSKRKACGCQAGPPVLVLLPATRRGWRRRYQGQAAARRGAGAAAEETVQGAAAAGARRCHQGLSNSIIFCYNLATLISANPTADPILRKGTNCGIP